MIKKLIKVGNSQALVLDKAMMELVGLAPESEVQVTVDGPSLRITAAGVGIGTKRVLEHTSAIRQQYGEALKRLA